MDPSLPASRTPIYSFNWASTIVSRARECHPRGWDIIMAFWGLSERQVVFLLACNDPNYAVMRSMAHQVEKWQDRGTRLSLEMGTTTQMCSSLLHLYRKSIESDMYEYLTTRISDMIMEEQVKKGAGGGDSRSRPSFEALDPEPMESLWPTGKTYRQPDLPFEGQ